MGFLNIGIPNTFSIKYEGKNLFYTLKCVKNKLLS